MGSCDFTYQALPYHGFIGHLLYARRGERRDEATITLEFLGDCEHVQTVCTRHFSSPERAWVWGYIIELSFLIEVSLAQGPIIEVSFF